MVPLATWGGANHVCVREFVPSMERALKDLGPHTIKFQHFPGGQLGQDKDMPMAIPILIGMMYLIVYAQGLATWLPATMRYGQ